MKTAEERVETYLRLHCYEDATFIAERLYARKKEPRMLYYLANCYFQQGDILRAYKKLAGTTSNICIESRYLLALSAFKLGKLGCAEETLTECLSANFVSFATYKGNAKKINVPCGSLGLLLLGKIYRASKKFDEAKACLRFSIANDPYLWTANKMLSELGDDVCDTYSSRCNGAVKMQEETRVNSDGGLGTGESNIFTTLKLASRGYFHLCNYRCSEALTSFSNLPHRQMNTTWVLDAIGQAYFGLADYISAAKTFKKLRQLESVDSTGMALYSTCLWHLKREIDLSYLAQTVIRQDRKSPETWCAVGNSFSLQKEHESALFFFQRAIRVKPTYVYSYTLAGHEYVSNEDFEKAIDFYRQAIRIDQQHYNAWYGLGTIYFRQEKYQLAHFHIVKAITINRNSSVLYCYLGMVISCLNPNDKANAMAALNKASELEPSNPTARYQKALLLSQMCMYEESLKELRNVRDFAPREASVRFEIGKLCAKMQCLDEARANFFAAHDLDPKNGNLYKGYVDKLVGNDMSIDDVL
jgi:anaphase-promoting complex subunit 3